MWNNDSRPAKEMNQTDDLESADHRFQSNVRTKKITIPVFSIVFRPTTTHKIDCRVCVVVLCSLRRGVATLSTRREVAAA